MRVLVVGLAVSGRAALRLLEGRGHEVVVYDRDPDVAADLADEREVHRGEWDPALLGGVELVVPSPGVPEHGPPIAAALRLGIPVWSELELAAQHLDVPLVAVTATNGKTTITRVAADMLAASGKHVAAVGNIGEPLCDVVGGDWDVLVVEASSFQLRFIETFHAQTAVLLNVAPDHLDWHGDFDAYLGAKARIHENQTPGDAIVFDADDDGATRAVSGAPSRRIPVSGTHRPLGGSGLESGKLWMGDAAVDIDALTVSDPAYLVDLAAAGMAALEMGADPAALVRIARAFRPGKHRREPVGEWSGVTWVNDSKATNPHAAVASIRAYRSVVLVAGGRNKDLDVAAIAREPSVRYVIGLGEEGPAVVAAAAEGELVGDMAQAVAVADRVARAGDTVLLAPGCASFDMYGSYGERGDHFADLVRELKGG
jgi:UDP-N-acetylmuramoylalanine--D-glutamate ligase